ncbi:TPA: dCTP deaminase, partial [Enterobacter cloacae subsp. cloacae]|nr:dCTP deaminase [Enterobacter cloacae subsp. cloacae]
MIYSNIDIISKVEAGSITIANYSDECMRPSSYLLRMDKKIFRMKKTESLIDTKHTDTSVFFDEIDLDDNGIIIHPGEFVLASSVEMISLDHTVCAELYQLSCYARIGLGVNFSSCHVAASFGENKPSSITFEIINNSC